MSLFCGPCLVNTVDLRWTFTCHFSNASTPTTRQTRNPYDDRGPSYGQRTNNFELSQVGNRNYDSAPVDDMTAFYNEVRATPSCLMFLLIYSCVSLPLLLPFAYSAFGKCRLRLFKMKSVPMLTMLTKFRGCTSNSCKT